MSHGPAAIVEKGVLNGQPIRAISYLEPEHSWETGYAAWSVTPEHAADAETELVCVQCFLNDFPEAARGMGLARQHGEATRMGDIWVAFRECDWERRRPSRHLAGKHG